MTDQVLNIISSIILGAGIAIFLAVIVLRKIIHNQHKRIRKIIDKKSQDINKPPKHFNCRGPANIIRVYIPIGEFSRLMVKCRQVYGAVDDYFEDGLHRMDLDDIMTGFLNIEQSMRKYEPKEKNDNLIIHDKCGQRIENCSCKDAAVKWKPDRDSTGTDWWDFRTHLEEIKNTEYKDDVKLDYKTETSLIQEYAIFTITLLWDEKLYETLEIEFLESESQKRPRKLLNDFMYDFGTKIQAYKNDHPDQGENDE